MNCCVRLTGAAMQSLLPVLEGTFDYELGHAHFSGEPHGEEANGAGAYFSIEQAGIRPILTDIAGIEQAVQAVISGQIEDHTEKLH
jgi:hypothetical protein